jgi:GT2 family glycosyltransferase
VGNIEASVIVPTYNQAGSIGSCLASLVRQTLPADRYEILVIDDGSTDGTASIVAGFAAPVRAVRLPHNRGRSVARNAGLREAHADLVVFIDSDVVVREDFLEWHLRTHRACGPGVLSRGPVVSVETLADVSRQRVPRLAASPAYLDTANAALERSAVIKAGMFDEAFPGYGWEDFELGFRLRAGGIRRVFCRQAAAFHLQPRMGTGDLDVLFLKEEARARSAVYFFHKHPTVETRLLIQATTLHWFLYWLMAGAGTLHRGNLAVLLKRLEAGRLAGLAPLVVRSVLNRHYVASLAQEFASHVPGMA